MPTCWECAPCCSFYLVVVSQPGGGDCAVGCPAVFVARRWRWTAPLALSPFLFFIALFLRKVKREFVRFRKRRGPSNASKVGLDGLLSVLAICEKLSNLGSNSV